MILQITNTYVIIKVNLYISSHPRQSPLFTVLSIYSKLAGIFFNSEFKLVGRLQFGCRVIKPFSELKNFLVRLKRAIICCRYKVTGDKLFIVGTCKSCRWKCPNQLPWVCDEYRQLYFMDSIAYPLFRELLWTDIHSDIQPEPY